MEIWLHKFDWKKFLANYHREGEAAPRGEWKALSLDYTDYVDSQSTNGAFADAFRLLRDRLPADISAPLGDFVAAISTCYLSDFPPLPDDTLPGQPMSNEEEMANIHSPATVQRVVSGLAAIPDEQLLAALTTTWPAIAERESDWELYEPERIPDPSEFLDYLTGWRSALSEIAYGNYGMGICGG